VLRRQGRHLVQLISVLVANQILSSSSARLRQRTLDTAITVLMLLPSGPDMQIGYAGIRSGRYRIDPGLVTALLDSTRDSDTQRAIVQSAAFACLPKHVYRRLFFRFWSRRRGDLWRSTLGRSLSWFLHQEPGEARLYAKAIWAMASDPDESVALAGLASTKYLGNALTLKGAKTLVAMSHDPTDRAIAALSNLGDLYQGLKNLRPEVRALLLASATIATLRSANPSDGRGQWSAYRWWLTNMRRALIRGDRTRVPTMAR